MQEFTVPEVLTLTYRSDLHFLVVRWMRPVLGSETCYRYQLILEGA